MSGRWDDGKAESGSPERASWETDESAALVLLLLDVFFVELLLSVAALEKKVPAVAGRQQRSDSHIIRLLQVKWCLMCC